MLLLNGPNLNRLGKREPEIYGHTTLKQIEERMIQLGERHAVQVECVQSNYEGALIDAIHKAQDENFDGIILNPAAFTHYSIALRDAIAGVMVPTVEIHISNVHKREEFRSHSVISPVSLGQIVGFGVYGYELAFYALLNHLKGETKTCQN